MSNFFPVQLCRKNTKEDRRAKKQNSRTTIAQQCRSVKKKESSRHHCSRGAGVPLQGIVEIEERKRNEKKGIMAAAYYATTENLDPGKIMGKEVEEKNQKTGQAIQTIGVLET